MLFSFGKFLRVCVAVFLGMGLVACGNPTQNLKPVVTVVTPVEGAKFGTGESIRLQLAAASSNNITRIEVRANNVLIGKAENDTPSPTFSSHVEFTPPQAGNYAITAIAFDSTGASSDSFSLNLFVGEGALYGVPEPTQPPQPTPTPQPGIIGSSGCTLSALFVKDVSVPDGTVFAKGQGFIKTWKMKNTSSCNWESGYKLKFLSDEIMGALPEIAVPPTPKDAEVDVSVQFIAPAQPGIYTSTWRLVEPGVGGKFFGNRVFVVVKVE